MALGLFHVGGQVGQLADVGAAADELAAGAPVADRHHPVHRLGDAPVMGNDHHRDAQLAVDLAQRFQHPRRGAPVDAAGGLVGEHQRRLVGQRDGNGHPLLLAAGELAGPAAQAMRHAHQMQQFLRPPAPLGAAGEQHRHLHVLDRGEVGNQVAGAVLPHEAHLLAPVADQLKARQRQQVAPGHGDLPGRGQVQAADYVEQRRLAAAAVADDRHQLGVGHLQIEALQRDHLELPALVDAYQVLAADHARSRGSTTRPSSNCTT